MSAVIDALQVLERARSLGASVTLADAESALAAVDRGAIAQQQARRFRVEVWDRRSPINGVPAERVLQTREDIPAEGDVYLIYIDGRLIFFQPRYPGGGPIPVGQGMQAGEEHADQLVEQYTDAEVMNQVLRSLLSNAGGGAGDAGGTGSGGPTLRPGVLPEPRPGSPAA